MPPETANREPAVIDTAEDPRSLPRSARIPRTAQIDHIGDPTTHGTSEAVNLGVVQYASSKSSEERCGAYFHRQVALIEGVRPLETTGCDREAEPKESTSEPMVINTAHQLSPLCPNLTEETIESPMEDGSTEPTGSKIPILPPIPNPGIQFLEALVSATQHYPGHRVCKPRDRDAKVSMVAMDFRDNLQVERQDMLSTSTGLTSGPITPVGTYAILVYPSLLPLAMQMNCPQLDSSRMSMLDLPCKMH